MVVENRMYKGPRVRYNMTGRHREELAEDMLRNLKQQLEKEREREKGAQDRLMECSYHIGKFFSVYLANTAFDRCWKKIRRLLSH